MSVPVNDAILGTQFCAWPRSVQDTMLSQGSQCGTKPVFNFGGERRRGTV